MKKIQDFLLYLLFFSINFEMWQPVASTGWFSIVKLTGILYLGSVILQPKGFFRISKMLKPLYIPLVLYFVFLTLMNVFNINTVSSVWFNTGFFQWMIMLVMMINHERMRPGVLPKSIMAFAMGSLVLSLLYFADIGTEYIYGERVKIFGDDPNSIGMRMAISTIILIHNALFNPLKQGKLRFILLLFIAPIILLLINTGSRIAIIALLILLVMMVFFMPAKNMFIKFGYSLVIIAVFGFAVKYAMTSDVMSERLISTVQKGDLAGRQGIWKASVSLIKENPIIGVGKTGYEEHSMNTLYKILNPHNVFLELLCYTGIIGTILYLTFFIQVGIISLKTFQRTKNALPILLLAGVFIMMNSMPAITAKLTWCVYAYIISTKSQ